MSPWSSAPARTGIEAAHGSRALTTAVRLRRYRPAAASTMPMARTTITTDFPNDLPDIEVLLSRLHARKNDLSNGLRFIAHTGDGGGHIHIGAEIGGQQAYRHHDSQTVFALSHGKHPVLEGCIIAHAGNRLDFRSRCHLHQLSPGPGHGHEHG